MPPRPIQYPQCQERARQPKHRRDKGKPHSRLPPITRLVRIIIPIERVEVDTVAAVVTFDIVYEEAEGDDLHHSLKSAQSIQVRQSPSR